MKKSFINHIARWSFALFNLTPLFARAQADSAKKPERQSLVYIEYHVINNQIPYVEVQTKNKLDKVFLPAGDVQVSVYLDRDTAADALIGKVTTNGAGIASMGLPPNLAKQWSEKPTHTFYAHSTASKDFDASKEEATVSFGQLKLDTTKGTESRSISVHLMKKEGNKWVPMPATDVRVAVKRYGGNLNISENEFLTTDSTGKIEAEFAIKNLPGDSLGNIELIASVEDNDEVGNLQTVLKVPWGESVHYKSEFGERSLWATGRRPPLWLSVMAYGCIIAVWSVIIYLISRIVKIRKLGTERSGG